MVGLGYDIHKLVDDRELYLGGIKIDFPKGLAGHSDGDVLLHAICDALLGAANLGDIGVHFPPDDPRYKNISSNEILKKVATFLLNTGFIARNIDAVVIAQAPKILPYKTKIVKNIATTLSIPETMISIKGKTNEGIGLIGETKAIAAWAVCEITRKYATPEG
jgi:2-C-methyl-D-erythritol 2,4-cyclodiphosphate synthase